jgi:hypothetical protein
MLPAQAYVAGQFGYLLVLGIAKACNGRVVGSTESKVSPLCKTKGCMGSVAMACFFTSLVFCHV